MMVGSPVSYYILKLRKKRGQRPLSYGKFLLSLLLLFIQSVRTLAWPLEQIDWEATMAAEVKVTGQNQEQFLLLAKSARGAALASLIHQVLEAPGIYVFGELLEMPNVREVSPEILEVKP